MGTDAVQYVGLDILGQAMLRQNGGGHLGPPLRVADRPPASVLRTASDVVETGRQRQYQRIRPFPGTDLAA